MSFRCACLCGGARAHTVQSCRHKHKKRAKCRPARLEVAASKGVSLLIVQWTWWQTATSAVETLFRPDDVRLNLRNSTLHSFFCRSFLSVPAVETFSNPAVSCMKVHLKAAVGEKCNTEGQVCQRSSAAHTEDERSYANSQPCSMPSVVVKFDSNRALFRVVVVLIYLRSDEDCNLLVSSGGDPRSSRDRALFRVVVILTYLRSGRSRSITAGVSSGRAR